MVNGIRIIYPSGLNKGISLKFCVGSRVQHEIPEEDQKMQWPKCYEDEENSLNILRDKT